MNSKLAKFFGFAVALLLIFELVGNMIVDKVEKEEKNPFDKQGMIKEGYEVDIEVVKEMEENSFPTVSDAEYNDQLLYAIGQCMFTAKEFNAYECLGNNIENDYFMDTSFHDNPLEKGKYLYAMLTKGNTITGFNYEKIELPSKSSSYLISVNLMERKSPYLFEINILNRKIVDITELEGNV